ncbi:DUF5916 domain-containing protein [Gracilimonas mengyeensis]|uniref:Carbohydrate family 9 binding domain-like n=1 Tax=Gracilimonas mengyeensis TaxID=1302730 RepID=A0A521F9I4_9BACT|nr:DUF5916 domain-containing protein [Gracilimonas mengyeensis]SMO92786.1 Carbohydrate family 9 binding domain-like [Gracilimonas mengyeensis]
MNLKYLTFLLCGLLVSQISFAQSSQEVKTYTTLKVNGNTPKIDGTIDEPAWQDVEWSGDFTQRSPDDGAKPSQKTAFKILYDDENLYVAIRAYDEEPDKIVQRLSRRDGFEGDWVEINIDSYFDKRTAYSFTASVSGVKGDEAITNDGDNWDTTWDPLWDLSTSIDNEGWIAEMRIPLTQLRFNANAQQVWGIQLTRRLYRNEERSVWSYAPQEESGWVRHFGELRGINGITPKKQVEIAPYTVAKMERYEADADNPFFDGTDENLSFGLDGKVGISNDFILDFTINPDFGQVEADPSEVNLTAFETFFQEKRPFFIEGRNITSFQISGGGNNYSSDNLFYSRRIGRSPHNYPDVDSDENEYARVPESTNIIGAVKLTGKTRNGLSVGVMESVTAPEKADVFRDGSHSKELVEPTTNYFLGSVQKELNDNNTILGGMFTSTHRFTDNPNLNNLNESAYSGGVEFQQFWNDKKYYLSTNLVMSQINGTSEAIQEQQESSRRYFQRPDNDYTTYDTTRTSLTGHGGIFEFGRQGSSGFRFVNWVTWRSPGLELNDVGYLRQGDSIFQVFWASYRFSNPFSIFRYMNLNFNQWTGWDFGGTNNFKGTNVNFSTQFTNHWYLNGGVNVDGDEVSNTLLRGGPSFRLPGGWNYWVNVETDDRKKLTFGLYHNQRWGFSDASDRQYYGIYARYQPTDGLRLSLQPNLTNRFNSLQYITTETYQTEDRYIFGSIDQVTVDLTMRMDLTLSPNLTIQYYGAPFVSAVDYYDPKYVTNPHADDYYDRFSEDVSFSDEDFENGYDFNFRQFRSNLVLRWEYRPGSLLYLVWTQGRTEEAETGNFSYGSDVNDLFSAHPHNVFLVKLSYLFGG